jgi:glycosyltransferase involved in cell wall biosynthesis
VRVAFVQTYPIYHDGVSTDEWLSFNTRELAMAAHLGAAGHQVEFWAVGERDERRDLGPAGAGFRFLVFPPLRRGGRSRDHTSPALVERARAFRAGLHFLKGVDGGIGTHLLRTHLVPERRDFIFVLGGASYSRFVPLARGVLCESAEQRLRLGRPGLRFWRPAVPAARTVFLPPVVDPRLFSPEPAVAKEWDILVACRLVARIKNLGVLGELGRRFRVAVAGSGPDEARLRSRHPGLAWLGRLPHAELPAAMRAARLFMHTGLRESMPRVIPEAMACGVPVVTFAGRVAPEAVPGGCGLTVPVRGFSIPIEALLRDDRARAEMGRKAREHALAHWGLERVGPPLDELMARLFR